MIVTSWELPVNFLTIEFLVELIKGALSGLRQFLATESPLKVMKNAFYSPQSFFRSQDI